jgi:hypothetical protein
MLTLVELNVDGLNVPSKSAAAIGGRAAKEYNFTKLRETLDVLVTIPALAPKAQSLMNHAYLKVATLTHSVILADDETAPFISQLNDFVAVVSMLSAVLHSTVQCVPPSWPLGSRRSPPRPCMTGASARDFSPCAHCDNGLCLVNSRLFAKTLIYFQSRLFGRANRSRGFVGRRRIALNAGQAQNPVGSGRPANPLAVVRREHRPPASARVGAPAEILLEIQCSCPQHAGALQ